MNMQDMWDAYGRMVGSDRYEVEALIGGKPYVCKQLFEGMADAMEQADYMIATHDAPFATIFERTGAPWAQKRTLAATVVRDKTPDTYSHDNTLEV